jgi:hypothetical protein
MDFIVLKNIEDNDVMVNTNNILYCFESSHYHPLNQTNYEVTKLVFGDETHLFVKHSLKEVQELIKTSR